MKNTKTNAPDRRKIKSGKALDVFVVLLCLSGITASLFLFQRDLFMSLRSLNTEQAGTVSIKYNTVQRRIQDRMVWDRLFDDSPVYDGDLIRVDRLSGATINIDDKQIELGENTLIRVQKDGDSINLGFLGGSVNVIAQEGGGSVFLSSGERVVQAMPGTSFSVSSDDSGFMLRVTEGAALISQGDKVIEAAQGSVILQDSQGNEVLEPVVVVTNPRPNARLLNNDSRPLNVEFNWTRMNIPQYDRLRLEISDNRNFSNIARSIDDLDTRAAAPLNSGVWHWRILHNGKSLASGRITVTNAPAPVAFSPAQDQTFYTRSANPEVQIRWSEISEAAYYHLQVSHSPDFSGSIIDVNAPGTSYISSDFNAGIWYWRVQPVFPSAYEGDKPFSQVSSFNIEIAREMPAPSLNSPLADSSIVIGEGNNEISFSWANIRAAASYTLRISNESEFVNPLFTRAVRNNYYKLGENDFDLVPGRYFWNVFYTDAEGNASAVSQTRSFITTEQRVIQRLVSPPDRYGIEDNQKTEVSFAWETNLSNDVRFQVSSSSDFSSTVIDTPVSGNSITGVAVPPGEWYWRITARSDARSVSIPSPARRFTMMQPPPVIVETPAPPPPTPSPPPPPAPARQPAAPPPRQPAPEPAPVMPLLRVTLLSPAQETVIPGLAALRESVVFRWDTEETIASSRFIISSNANPSVGRPHTEILNPGREIKIDNLGEGLWYWTVTGFSSNGRSIAPQEPMRLRVLPVPLLPPPDRMAPVNRFTIGIEELKNTRDIVFSWSAVEGANYYILTILREGFPRNRQIFQSDLMTELTFTFDDLSLLENHDNIFWNVEAVFVNAEGKIEQRGQLNEYTLILNVPRPGRVRTRGVGVMYGTE